MKVYVGADHRGFHGRQKVVDFLKKIGYEVEDDSNQSLNPEDDYPVIAKRVVSNILTEKNTMGILICASGQGVCIAANRSKGIRAALASNAESVKAARNDDDVNVLCLPAEDIEKGKYEEVIRAFLETPFAAAPRFIRRIKEMDQF